MNTIGFVFSTWLLPIDLPENWCRYSQTGTILRVPHMAEGVSLVGKAGSMDDRDKRMAEEFMMWVA